MKILVACEESQAVTIELRNSSCISKPKQPNQKIGRRGFPGGQVVKNLPANAEDMGLIPGPGRFQMPQSD